MRAGRSGTGRRPAGRSAPGPVLPARRVPAHRPREPKGTRGALEHHGSPGPPRRPGPSGTGWFRPDGQAFFVSRKMVSISAIRSRRVWPVFGSFDPFVALAALRASLNNWWSCGYFSKCGALK